MQVIISLNSKKNLVKCIKASSKGGDEPVELEVLDGISEDLKERANNLISFLKERGIRDYGSKKIVFPSDGEVFLKNLPHHYKSAYIRATLVKDKEA